jgi:hypothetical protein
MMIVGCTGSDGPAPATNATVSPNAKVIYMKSNKVNYSADSRIAQNIKNECKLDTKLVTFIQKAAAGQGMVVKISDTIPADATELKVEITDAVSQGHAMGGFGGRHNKFTGISGSLIENGKTIGTFDAARRSSGGFMGGFKGSCSVLGRTVQTLGSDVSKWMVNPTMGDALGDRGLIRR